MSKFREEFRIETSRLPGYDYSSDGSYFVTICTKDKKHYFGEIESGSVFLSEIGLLIDKFWNEIPIHFPMAVLDAYVIMPDHIHGIIIINKKFDHSTPVETRNLRVSTTTRNNESVETRNFRVSTPESIDDSLKTRKLRVSTNTSLDENHGDAQLARLYNHQTGQSQNSSGTPHMKSGSISSIINQFKRVCTITIRNSGNDFEWQPRFYDHIIRSLDELNTIRDYINNNPRNWEIEL